MRVLTGDDRFTEHVDKFEKSKEAVNMCKVLDEVENRGILIGEKRGEKRGEERGEKRGEQNAKNHMILNMIRKDYPVEDIAEVAEVTVEYVVKIKDGELQIV